MFISCQLSRSLTKMGVRYCHHDKPVKLQDYHVIGLHQNLQRMVKEITLLRETCQRLEGKIDILENKLMGNHEDPHQNAIKNPKKIV